ncbi:hypothetical protein M3G47_00110 [Corynebacterium sanguinis]|uniref:AMIN-like domain-containing (lipo)protein n=1 Tax=Corynebacterium sanguinis TaxID=2594913 RepID=UPI00223A82DF|nr:hypothetical protein [Corynebacterium sanguinis]MCT1491580.1 hypothetical protein [Corynebacterium sanguinis]MCT2246500.1 hypothetical protein [Corynebacterium sanguinis]MCT2288761.1 hypothetical protein [Corynebacterium sanguinis]
MKLTSRYFAPVTLVTALALGSCTGAPENNAADQAPSATTTAATTATTTMTSVSPTTTTSTVIPTAQALSAVEETTSMGPFGTDRVQAYPAPGTELVISDVRVGSHDDFDRVVFEFSGTGTPGYVAGYTPEPLQQASGYPIEVNGQAYLEVMIQGTPMAMLSPNDALIETGPMDLAAGNIQGVTHGGVFEADTQYIVGLDKQRPFNLYVLENPARVVVDFQN